MIAKVFHSDMRHVVMACDGQVVDHQFRTTLVMDEQRFAKAYPNIIGWVDIPVRRCWSFDELNLKPPSYVARVYSEQRTVLRNPVYLGCLAGKDLPHKHLCGHEAGGWDRSSVPRLGWPSTGHLAFGEWICLEHPRCRQGYH